MPEENVERDRESDAPLRAAARFLNEATKVVLKPDRQKEAAQCPKI